VTYFVGADIGGIFTDCVLIDAEVAARLHKSPTALGDAARGVMNALRLAEADLGLDERTPAGAGAVLRPRRHRRHERTHRARRMVLTLTA